MRPLPRRARQTSKVGHIHNQMVGHVQSLHPNKSNGKLQIHTSLGIFERDISTQRRPSSQKVQFRGEFAKGFAYSNGDLVRVSAGPEAGTYIAIKNVPVNASNDPQYLPWTGFGYWVLLARLTDQSQWV